MAAKGVIVLHSVLLLFLVLPITAQGSIDDEPGYAEVALPLNRPFTVAKQTVDISSPSPSTSDGEFEIGSGEGSQNDLNEVVEYEEPGNFLNNKLPDPKPTIVTSTSTTTSMTTSTGSNQFPDKSTKDAAGYEISSQQANKENITTMSSHSSKLLDITTPESTTISAEQRQTTSSSDQLPTLQTVMTLLSTQQEVLEELKGHFSQINSRLDIQQNTIDRQEQVLDDHSWKLAEISRNQIQTTGDLHALNSAIKTHQHDAEASYDRESKDETLTDDVHQMESRLNHVEHVQASLASVLQHLISERVWESTAGNISTDQPEYTNHSMAKLADEVVEDSELAGNPIEEVDFHTMQERANQLLISVERWNHIEQILHVSLSDLHTDHHRYDQAIGLLTNYTLNNALVISQLSLANIDGGDSIQMLMNSSSWLSEQVYLLKEGVRQNRNLSQTMIYRTERNLDQLLELIQLNSMKVTTLQDAIREQSSAFKSQLNYTSLYIFGLEDSLNTLGMMHNSSYSVLTEKLQSNKEKSDMLWSRFRILDNRLAHVEVKYLTEELNKYQKSNDDLRQSLKLMEMENDLETVNENINIQQTNHETLNRKLISMENKVADESSSLKDMESAWNKFSDRLPRLELMYNEVQMMINILPEDCDDVYNRGIQRSGVQLARPGTNHSSLKLLCHIDKVDERGWTVIQQRLNGVVNFNQNWTQYRDGFGVVDSGQEFWLGNEAVHTLTSKFNYTIRFDMWTINGSYVYAEYDNFQLLSESEGYGLQVSGYSGNATDSLKHSNGNGFSTIDVDNDRSSTHCAQYYTAGWWYKHCQYGNLNGRYTVGIVWFDHNNDYWMELKQTSISISRQW